ncbi:hypothetical protein BT67DRAFT_223522 [Trichocladium antarcticum]|uniref:Clr5 domain-containing protein n=1 Tax=Trichocladium antarcticum TaxID=1450529 RepID=A0AAN6UC36_9PEZI|nr:hypothetical protein BT67DRAFT_223522 [Trichocladium antarcticum]
MTLIRLTDRPDSKRMYDKRFREWNVFKNADRDERARAVRHAQGSPSSTGPCSNGDKFSQEDLRRTIRCARTIQQGVKRAPAPSSPISLTGSENVACPSPGRTTRGGISISDLIRAGDPPERPTTPQPTAPENCPRSPPSVSDVCCDTPISSSESSDEHMQGQDESAAPSAPASPDPSLAIYRARLQDLAMSPPPSIAPDSQTRTMGVITLKLRQYYDWQLENIPEGVLPDDYLGHRSSAESTRYWSTIKDAIYLVKISAGSTSDYDHRPDRRAWPAFAEAGRLAADAMTTHPFEFLRNLLSTLSPVNTSARPELRGILLQFLSSEARSSLSTNHPITQICQELQGDENCQEISQRSLQCMLDIFNSRLGRSRAITVKLLDSLATLLRRSGEFHAGLEIIKELLVSSRPVFGADSDQVRAVESELAHFYMLTEDCDSALGHCMSVVTRPGAPGPHDSEPVFHKDGISAHAMEDIAEIHQRRGDMEQCITWLERASSIALIVWGPKAVATGHLIDKMTSLQRRFGSDLLKSATLWEAAVV